MKELLCSNRTSIKDPEMKKLYPKVMEELFARTKSSLWMQI